MVRFGMDHGPALRPFGMIQGHIEGVILGVDLPAPKQIDSLDVIG
jgi:hypothetical protein